jgi:CheY-like chemotaxis protein
VIISAYDEPQRSLKHGALRCLSKPVAHEQVEQAFRELHDFIGRPVKRLLVVEDNDAQRLGTIELIANPEVEITTAKDAEAARALLGQQEFDCLVIDLRLPGRVSGHELLEELQNQPRFRHLPIVVYTAKELAPAEEARLRQLARSIILKDVRSPERLLDQTTLLLHTALEDLTPHQQQLLRTVHSDKAVLAGRKVLLVDDDIRNVFAMTSVLERYDMEVIPAENGREALEELNKRPDVDVVLMDIMLPEMDGYEVTQTIRRQERFRGLPILALTAKAMKGDREKCLEAGCSDYVSKPVDTEQLLSVLRLWLHR